MTCKTRLFVFILSQFLTIHFVVQANAPVVNNPRFVVAEEIMKSPGRLAVPGNDEYPVLKYDNAVYWPTIHTPISNITGVELSPPIMALNSGESITFSFDELSGSVKDFRYNIIHCDVDWNPSGLMEQEYLTGYFSYNITQYDFSFNTFQNYVHYELQLPNERTQLTKSGNYILVIYANNNPDDIVLSRKFMVYENLTNITAQPKRASDPAEMFYKQEIDFKVNISSLQINNAYTDVEVVVLQNYRWDNCLRHLKPRFVRDGELVFDLDNPDIFNGGSEFRYLDLKSIAYRTPNVARIVKDSVPYTILLLDEENRGIKKYISSKDINGNFIVRNENTLENHNIESDYLWAYFFLPYKSEQTDGDFYLFGNFCDWQLKPEFKMEWNPADGKYEKAVLLKQGYYNYEYVFVKNGTSKVDETLVEGNHYETENQYTILVYQRDYRLSYYRLVGFKQVNSVNQ